MKIISIGGEQLMLIVKRNPDPTPIFKSIEAVEHEMPLYITEFGKAGSDHYFYVTKTGECKIISKDCTVWIDANIDKEIDSRKEDLYWLEKAKEINRYGDVEVITIKQKSRGDGWTIVLKTWAYLSLDRCTYDISVSYKNNDYLTKYCFSSYSDAMEMYEFLLKATDIYS